MLNDIYKEAMNKMLGVIRKKILKELDEMDETIRVARLSQRFDMSMPLVTFHVNMLIGHGLIERNHSGSGSVTGVRITEKGRELVKKLQ